MGWIESATDKGKELLKLAQKLDNIELIQKIIDLQSDQLHVQEELQALRKENEELKNIEKIDQELVRRESVYWRNSAPETRRGPFCMTCWDAKRKLVTLTGSDREGYTCRHCEEYFSTETSRASAERDMRDAQSLSDPDNTLGTMFGL